LLVFFFQADDGIRDYKVTGVQTCGLPISFTMYAVSELNLLPGKQHLEFGHGVHSKCRAVITTSSRCSQPPPSLECLGSQESGHEIGRASCRERVYKPGGATSEITQHTESY